MNLKLEIRRNSDGVIATDVWKEWTWNEFWWEYGNASCDCNRESFFLHAQGEEEPEDIQCSTGRYSVRLCDNDTEEVLYDEITGKLL